MCTPRLVLLDIQPSLRRFIPRRGSITAHRVRPEEAGLPLRPLSLYLFHLVHILSLSDLTNELLSPQLQVVNTHSALIDAD